LNHAYAGPYIRAVTDPNDRPQSGGDQPELSIDAMYESLLKQVESQKKAASPSAAATAVSRSTPMEDKRLPQQLNGIGAGAGPGAGMAVGAGAGTNAETSTNQRSKNAWGRNVLILLVIAAVAYGYVHFRHPFSSATTADPLPSRSAHPTVAPVPAITVAQAFAATVPGPNGETYTLVGARKLTSCVEPDMVETYLAGLLTQSDGCAGAIAALYGDGAENEFTVAVFTLDDPADVISIETTLAMNPTDYEVGALAPPPSSGLAVLSATSGVVQAFTGVSHALVIGVAQWSDGRSADFNDLETLLQPLQQAVTLKASAAKS
jgi:hypothetical protein